MLDLTFINFSVVVLCLILGLTVGSFLNVLIYRLPRHLNTPRKNSCRIKCKTMTFSQHLLKCLTVRSICPHCKHQLAAWENIPLFSYWLLDGSCHACHASISRRYPLIEALTAITFALSAWRFGWSDRTLFACVLMAFLIALSAIDWEFQLLPDVLTLPLLALGLVINQFEIFVAWDMALFGAILGYIILYASNALFYQIRGKVGMGGGDLKLTAALGAWLGIYALPKLILIAALLHLGTALVRRWYGERVWQQRLPFGPWLSGAGIWLILTL